MRKLFLPLSFLSASFLGGCSSGTHTIPVETAHRFAEDSTILFIDLRNEEDPAATYDIKNLHFIPLSGLAEKSETWAKNQKIVLVGVTDAQSEQAYKTLQEKGFKEVYVMKGGIQAWEAAGYATKPKMSKQKKLLTARLEGFRAKASEEIKNIYAQGLQKLRDEKVAQKALHVGEKAPDFTLRTEDKKSVHLYAELKKGPVVLVWYRGEWCPYCNIALASMQKLIPEFEKLGAHLLALSPELHTDHTKKKLSLSFTLLSDRNNEIAKKYGIVFKLDKKVADNYNKSFGLNTVNGNDKEELPMPATFVIDKEGIIRYAFADEDYTQRAEPSDILAAVQKIAK